MEFVRTTIKATIYGEVFSLRRPTFEEREVFSESMAAAVKAEDTKTVIALQKEFVAKMGIPIEFVAQMEAEHVDALALELITKKKG